MIPDFEECADWTELDQYVHGEQYEDEPEWYDEYDAGREE